MKQNELLSKEKRVRSRGSVPVNDSFISPAVIIWIIIGIVLLSVLVHIGFFKTYIRYFPQFEGFTTAQHFHGIMMMGWLLMLLVQPILILNKKTQLHRRLGALSYILAPLLLLSIFLVMKTRYDIYLEQGRQTNAVLAWLSLNFRLMLFFAVLYLLAIYYRHKPGLHLRFMCSTALLLIGPGLVRLLISYPEFSHADSHTFDRNVNVLIAGIITLIDSWKTKRVSPFTLVFVFMAMQKVLWDMRDAPLLQSIGKVIAKMF